MAKKSSKVKRKRLVEELLDAAEHLTELRRELRLLCIRTRGLHTVVGSRMSPGEQKAYLKGMHKTAEEVDGILDKARKPQWRCDWALERQEQLEVIRKLQRRTEGVFVRLVPEPKDEAELDREVMNIQATEDLERLSARRKELYGKIRSCDADTEIGRFEIEALQAELERIDRESASLNADILVDWINRLDCAARESPKGSLRTNARFLMLALYEKNGTVAAYQVRAPDEDAGREHLQRESGREVICVYTDWKEAGRLGFHWQAAVPFTVNMYTSGEVECEFDIDLG